MKVASQALFWTVLAYATVCLAKHKIECYVPKNCMHDITITDFTKPCRLDAKNPNAASCDGVKIRFSCVEYR